MDNSITDLTKLFDFWKVTQRQNCFLAITEFQESSWDTMITYYIYFYVTHLEKKIGNGKILPVILCIFLSLSFLLSWVLFSISSVWENKLPLYFVPIQHNHLWYMIALWNGHLWKAGGPCEHRRPCSSENADLGSTSNGVSLRHQRNIQMLSSKPELPSLFWYNTNLWWEQCFTDQEMHTRFQPNGDYQLQLSEPTGEKIISSGTFRDSLHFRAWKGQAGGVYFLGLPQYFCSSRVWRYFSAPSILFMLSHFSTCYILTWTFWAFKSSLCKSVQSNWKKSSTMSEHISTLAALLALFQELIRKWGPCSR